MKQRLMDLYFTEGADLSDREVLVQAAADVGMDADKTREMLASDTDVERSRARPIPPRTPASTACRPSSWAASRRLPARSRRR